MTSQLQCCGSSLCAGESGITSKMQDIAGGVGGVFYQRVGELFSSSRIMAHVTLSANKPTVSLDVISLVASSYGYYRGVKSSTALRMHSWCTWRHRELAKRLQHRHPPRAQPVAPLRERHCRCPRLPPRSCTDQAPHREQGHPGGYTPEEKRLHRFTFLVMRGAPTYPIFASWPWPRHNSLLVGSD